MVAKAVWCPPQLAGVAHDEPSPACFDTVKTYREWVALAKLSKEPCSICLDCSMAYRVKMQQAGRCDQALWANMVINRVRRAAPPLPPPNSAALGNTPKGRRGRPKTPIRAALLTALLDLQAERAHLAGLARGATVREVAERARVGLSGGHKYMPLLEQAGAVYRIGMHAAEPHTKRPVKVYMVSETIGSAASGVAAG